MDSSPSSRGRLEAFRDGQIRGWAAYKDAPKAMASVQVAIDGVPFATVRANRGRQDLQAKGLAIDCGGFVMPLSLSPTGTDKIEVQARVAGETRWIAGSSQQVTGLNVARGIQAAPWHLLSTTRPKVSIIIPVYNAPDDLDLCLKSVLAHTGGEARLIVIDDASPDPRVTQVLAPYRDRHNITILVNDRNLGFTRTCNRGIEIAGRDDIILLNSDTIVPERWIENLIVAAYSSPRTASATPLSDNAGAFSAPELGGSNRIPPGLSDNDLSRLVAQASLATYPQVPTGHGYCLYFRRDALDAIGPLDAAAFPRGYGEENDLCMRALRAGFHHVVDDRTYVRHRQSASFGASKTELLAEGRAVLDERYPEYKRLVQMFGKDERMLGMRWRVRRAFLAGVRPRPRVLFVISTDSGGTPQTNLDLMQTLEDRYEPWLMRCSGQQIILQRLVEGKLQPVSKRTLDAPLVMSLHRSEEYNDVVAEMLLAHAIELMHVRHLAWHGLDLPRIGKALGIPVILSLHDFYTICPTIKLLDGEMKHCAGRCTVGEGECRAELWPADQVPQLRHRFVHRWREMMAIAIDACDAFVTTSAHARHLLTETYPQMQASDFRVIEHGRSFDAFLPTGAPPQAGSPVRILVPGNISFAKGAELIRAMAALDGGRRVEFHILGDHGALQAMPGLILHGRYTRDAFLGRVAEIAPHLGAVFSIWPETYCHTLTELWASGLPVFALDTGAVGERIHAHGAGWLTTSQEPAELLEIILAAVTDEADFGEKLAQVRAWQEGHGTERDLRAMAADYDVLYRDVIKRRLVFSGHSKKSVESEDIIWTNDDYNANPEEQLSGGKPLISMSAM